MLKIKINGLFFASKSLGICLFGFQCTWFFIAIRMQTPESSELFSSLVIYIIITAVDMIIEILDLVCGIVLFLQRNYETFINCVSVGFRLVLSAFKFGVGASLISSLFKKGTLDCQEMNGMELCTVLKCVLVSNAAGFLAFTAIFFAYLMNYTQETNLIPLTITSSDDNCSICMTSDEQQWVKTICSHEFHDSCIKEWIKQNPTCPLCRQSLAL